MCADKWHRGPHIIRSVRTLARGWAWNNLCICNQGPALKQMAPIIPGAIILMSVSMSGLCQVRYKQTAKMISSTQLNWWTEHPPLKHKNNMKSISTHLSPRLRECLDCCLLSLVTITHMTGPSPMPHGLMSSSPSPDNCWQSRLSFLR